MEIRTNPTLLELDVMRSFIAIVETGNFSRAAEMVHRTPSAISMQMKKLEDQLGVTVLQRDSRSVSLTNDGEKLLHYARRMLALNREALAEFNSDDLAGLVRVGAPDNIGDDVLPEVLRHLRENHPGVRVDVKIDLSANLLHGLSQKQFDLVLFTCAMDGSNVPRRAEVIYTEPMVWVGAKAGTAFERNPLPVSMWDEPCTFSRNAKRALTDAGRDFVVAYQSQYIGAQKAAIRADMVVSSLGLSQVDSDLTILTELDGLPDLQESRIGMVVQEGAAPVVMAVTDYFRSAFQDLQLRSNVPVARVA